MTRLHLGGGPNDAMSVAPTTSPAVRRDGRTPGKSLAAENEKYRLGASTTQLVLQQKRNVASAEANYITAVTTYARDRASLEQVLANTLEKYGIDLADTASGAVTKQPVVPGLVPAQNITPTDSQQEQTPANNPN